MLGSIVYDAVLNQLRADKRGKTVTVDEFNNLSRIVNKRALVQYTRKFEQDIDNTNSLGFLKKIGVSVSLTTGVASLPDKYHRIIGEPYYTDAGAIRRNVDVVTSAEHSYRESDYLTQSTLSHPTCVIGGQSNDANKYLQIRVAPTTISTIFIDYLREPATPFLDYFITNANLNYTFLASGLSYTVTSAQTYRTGGAGVFNSATVDWEWDESDLPLIVAMFVEYLGAIIPDELMIEAGNKDKTEISQ